MQAYLWRDKRQVYLLNIYYRCCELGCWSRAGCDNDLSFVHVSNDPLLLGTAIQQRQQQQQQQQKMEKSELLDNESTAGDRCCSRQSGCYAPKRYIMVALLFAGMVICHAQRVNVGVTVVAILDEASHTKVKDPQSISSVSTTLDLS